MEDKESSETINEASIDARGLKMLLITGAVVMGLVAYKLVSVIL